MKRSKENNTDTAFKNTFALEITKVLIKQKSYENPGCPVDARVTLETYNSYLTNENLPQRSNVTHFEKMILYYTKEFEIRKSIMNVFILKPHYVNHIQDGGAKRSPKPVFPL